MNELVCSECDCRAFKGKPGARFCGTCGHSSDAHRSEAGDGSQFPASGAIATGVPKGKRLTRRQLITGILALVLMIALGMGATLMFSGGGSRSPMISKDQSHQKPSAPAGSPVTDLRSAAEKAMYGEVVSEARAMAQTVANGFLSLAPCGTDGACDVRVLKANLTLLLAQVRALKALRSVGIAGVRCRDAINQYDLAYTTMWGQEPSKRIAAYKVFLQKAPAVRSRCGFNPVSMLKTVPIGLSGASAHAKPAAVLLPDCGSSLYGGSPSPVTWDYGCTGSTDLAQMTWHDWGQSYAWGDGKSSSNDCNPDCARGAITEVTVRAIAWGISTCSNPSGRKALYYTRLFIGESNESIDSLRQRASAADSQSVMEMNCEVAAGDSDVASAESCGGGVYAGPSTSCAFASNVAKAWSNQGGGSVTVKAFSPVTRLDYAMVCIAGVTTVCRGGTNAVVFIR